MSLFFCFFSRAGLAAEMGGFAMFFRGGFWKKRILVWCFDGEVVVDCVVIVDRRCHVAWRLKICHFLRFIFTFDVEKERRRVPFWEGRTDVTTVSYFFTLILRLFSL